MEDRILALGGWKRVKLTVLFDRFQCNGEVCDVEECLNKVCISVERDGYNFEALCNMRALLEMLKNIDTFVLYVKGT